MVLAELDELEVEGEEDCELEVVWDEEEERDVETELEDELVVGEVADVDEDVVLDVEVFRERLAYAPTKIIMTTTTTTAIFTELEIACFNLILNSDSRIWFFLPTY